MSRASLPLFVKRDLDGFFGLFVDNLVQLLLILALCSLCGIAADSDLMTQAILPGVAVSLIAGNLFYAWQAHRLAKREGRDDVTALPYGINTPSLIVYVFFVMKPVFDQTGDPTKAWQAGLIACLGSGLIELLGAFIAEPIRKRTPRAALLSTLAGIAVGFIAMTFALQIFQRPMVAMLPLGLILLSYFSGLRFPAGLPGGFLAVLAGTACAWLFPLILPETIAGPAMSFSAVQDATATIAWSPPIFRGSSIWTLLQHPEQWIAFLSVIIPMGLFNLIGSLQNIESAEAAGDRFTTSTSLAANGIGTIIAACFGSCFPTTIYIGHPGWKALGARAGYSTLNGIVITAICLSGTLNLISRLIPLEAGIAIILWIGIIIVAQAFRTTPERHAGAVAIGLFPAIAAWGATVMMGVFATFGFMTDAELTIQSLLSGNLATEVNGFLVHAMIVLERGYIFTCMILAAATASLVDRRFTAAAIWTAIGAAFTFLGLMHAYQVSGSTVDYLFRFQQAAEGVSGFRADGIAIGYLMLSGMFALTAWTTRIDSPDRPVSPDGSDRDDSHNANGNA